METLSRISVRRPVFATVLMLTIVVVGLVGYRSLGVDKFPRIDFPMVVITTIYPGASPTSVEDDVTDKIEAAVNTVSGIETLSSISSEGASLVFAQFDLDKNPDVAAQEIRDRIATIRDLPTSIRPPQIQKADPDASPVLMLSIKGSLPIQELTQIAEDQVKARLERVGGVGMVRVVGGQKRRIEVALDPIRLAGAKVSALEVVRTLSVCLPSLPAGRFERGPDNATMRIECRGAGADAIGQLIVRQMGDGPIRVRDVADVMDTIADPESAAVRDGTPAILLAVRKQSGANTVAVVDAAKAAAAEIAAALPPGVSLDVVRDNSEVIRTSAALVTEHLWLGAFLAAVVVLVFLGSLRSTIIAAVAIPISIVGTFALMNVAGFTLNLMTLLALALAVGIVIDDAIVVLENIYRHIDEHGEKPFPAAVKATKEISLAVLATTLSLMAVFLPVAFMSGIVGRFLLSFGLTMAFAIGVSMLVSFTITPMMAARMLPLPPPPGEHRKKSILERIIDGGYLPIERAYTRILRFLLRHWWMKLTVVLLSLATCVSSGPLGKAAGFGFLPDNDEAHFEIYVKTKEGTGLDATTIIAERLARHTRTIPEVTHTLVTVADNDQKVANVASVYVRLTDPAARDRSQAAVMEQVRKQVLPLAPADAKVSVELVNDFSLGGQRNSMIQYLITGPDLDRLSLYAERILTKLKDTPGVVDLDSSLPSPLPETTLRPNLDRAAALGVDPADLTATLAVLMGGQEAPGDEELGSRYVVMVRANERFRTDPSLLGQITVPSRTLGQVPLTDVVVPVDGLGPSQITRTARSKSITILANVAPGYAEGDIVAALDKAIEELDLPPGYTAGPFGRSKEMAKTGKAFLFAFLLSFVFMYLVLAAQFESWLHPLTIMLALPLTMPFAFLSVILFGGQLNIFSMLGLLVLFGVVKKNSILQIDHAIQLRARGQGKDEAIVNAARDRLRPILMTTFAFVAGMLPLLVSKGVGAGFSKAIAGIVVGGQTMSLVLTLLAIPVFYSVFDSAAVLAGRAARWIWHDLFRRPRGGDRGEAEVAEPPVAAT
ncbi:MAG: efflux RND transporter permease subunit [Kofleriaceae bacterium]|nr:efflux RND transporter permease subunit [Kofleriaceae bacterium]MBP9167021.1 efflux RND transporter permease subunit [Kofleriaceae bacterium]MBP9858332.1 efflux RND transporter permease subunit [Kofleriaceae bacterium]